MKKPIKNLVLLLAVLAVAFLLAGCEKADVTSTLVITNDAGAGHKTITFAIPADRETVVDTGTNNGVEYHIYNNSTYFPKGYEAFCDWILARLPDKGYTYEIREEDASFVYIDVKYSFDSFEEYAQKTRALMGEERWDKCDFFTPGLLVSRVEDPGDNNYGRIRVTFAESKYMTAGCADRLMEIGICQEAVDEGVLAPYGDSFKNKDCRQMFIDYDPSEDTFEEFAKVYYLAKPGEVCNNVGDRTFVYGDVTYTEKLGNDAMVSVYHDDDGSYTLTDLSDWLPEGADQGFLTVLEDGLYLCTPKADLEDDGVWSMEDYDRVKISLGSKPAGPKALKTDLVPLKTGLPTWGILLIVAAVVVVAAAVVLVLVLRRRAGEDEGDEDEEDDENEDDED